MADRPHLRVLDHPLIADKVTRLRDHRTGHREFGDLIREIGALMAYEVLRDLPAEEVEVETPLEITTGLRVREEDVVLVPILRAGWGCSMASPPCCRARASGTWGSTATRRRSSRSSTTSTFRAPKAASSSWSIPCWARAGHPPRRSQCSRNTEPVTSASRCWCRVRKGVEALESAHPDVPVFTAAMDRRLNEHGYILPGLGDAGDRIFGSD